MANKRSTGQLRRNGKEKQKVVDGGSALFCSVKRDVRICPRSLVAPTRMLIDLMDADRAVCGTDFPQGMAIKKPVEYVEAIPNISEKECQVILCDNPSRLLRL